MLFLMLMTILMLMLMSVCDEESEDDDFVVDVDVGVDVYELFNHCIVTGWVTNPSLRIILCFVMEKRSHGGQIYKTLHCKNKTTYFHLHLHYQRS